MTDRSRPAGTEILRRLATLTRRYERPLWIGLSGAGVVLAVGLFAAGGRPGFDLLAYWLVEPTEPYGASQGQGAFHYSPPIAWLFAPLKAFPWPLVYWLWLMLLLAVLAWLGRRWWLALLAFPPVVIELYHGNIHLLLAAATVLGLRHPAAWSFSLLTKVTPGIVLVWYVARREWRSLAIGLGVALAVGLASFAVSPSTWVSWLYHLQVAESVPTPNQVPIPLALRLPVAAAIVYWGARTDRPWTLALGTTLALPVLWFHGFAILAALAPLLRRSQGAGSASVGDTSPATLPTGT